MELATQELLGQELGCVWLVKSEGRLRLPSSKWIRGHTLLCVWCESLPSEEASGHELRHRPNRTNHTPRTRLGARCGQELRAVTVQPTGAPRLPHIAHRLWGLLGAGGETPPP